MIIRYLDPWGVGKQVNELRHRVATLETRKLQIHQLERPSGTVVPYAYT